MNIGTIVIVKYHPDMPAWQAEFTNERGTIVGERHIAGVLHLLVQFGRGPALEYRPHELQEAEPEEAAA